tara:strand:+ start:251 stop:463 length:213 start_codon:yes stop_codon:yes gene_type:complete
MCRDFSYSLIPFLVSTSWIKSNALAGLIAIERQVIIPLGEAILHAFLSLRISPGVSFEYVSLSIFVSFMS